VNATWRIAVRDARKAKGRSALVIAMIAVPIVGVGTADVLYRTFQLTPDQKATRLLGAADAYLHDSGQTSIEQDPGGGGYSSPGDHSRTGPAPAYTSVLPAGSRVLTYGYGGGAVTRGDRTVSVSVTDVPYTDPLTKGMYRAASGQPAARPGEVALSRELAHRLGARLRSTVTVDGVARVVTGVVDSQSGSKDLLALEQPGTLGHDSVLVDVPGQLTWSDVQRANAQGFELRPRGHVPGEPPPSPHSTMPISKTTVTFVALIAGLVLLEIVLLAGPAFAVGVKRRSRDLALVAATGGERRHLRAIVLSGGVALGLVGGALGATAGVALAWFVVPVFGGLNGTVPGPFEVRPLEVLAIVGVGVLTALLAAMIPARTAARTDVLAALTGRRGSCP
jgi:putative ABC transport system permease protein